IHRGDRSQHRDFTIRRNVAGGERLLPLAGLLQGMQDVGRDKLFQLSLHRLSIQPVGGGDEEKGVAARGFARTQQEAYLYPLGAQVGDRLLQYARVVSLKTLQVGAQASANEPALLLHALQQQGVALLISQAKRTIENDRDSDEDCQKDQ